jgi:hypothetical protein
MPRFPADRNPLKSKGIGSVVSDNGKKTGLSVVWTLSVQFGGFRNRSRGIVASDLV